MGRMMRNDTSQDFSLKFGRGVVQSSEFWCAHETLVEYSRLKLPLS
jgi:hypothetical protein